MRVAVDKGARDEQLAAMAAKGRRDAFGELVRRHQEKVVRIAARYASPSEAEDIAQDAFLAAFRAIRSFRVRSRFGTWLYRIVVNVCLTRRRRKRPIPLPMDQVPATAGDLADRVREAVAALPDRQRIAVILHRFDGLSYRELAEIMELSEHAVESLLARAYRNLREILGA
jgi:RNA polymerase sigma-70 factor (ECF subfamily)